MVLKNLKLLENWQSYMKKVDNTFLPKWLSKDFSFTIKSETIYFDDIYQIIMKFVENKNLIQNQKLIINSNDLPLLITCLCVIDFLPFHLIIAPSTSDQINVTRAENNSLSFKNLMSDKKHKISIYTSGTTGAPKLISHNLNSLLGRIKKPQNKINPSEQKWLLHYSPSTYAGIQVILNTIVSGSNITDIPTDDITHISITPSSWKVLMLSRAFPNLKSLTLGGEATEQQIIDITRKKYPLIKIQHIYATSEAGALFSVKDNRSGFPLQWLENGIEEVNLRKSNEGVLEVQNLRPTNENKDWIATGDLITIIKDRVFFEGRIDNIINVGGTNINPQFIENHFLQLEDIYDVHVFAKPNPITGNLIAMDIVKNGTLTEDLLLEAINEHSKSLKPEERPRIIKFTDEINLASSGKKLRRKI